MLLNLFVMHGVFLGACQAGKLFERLKFDFLYLKGFKSIEIIYGNFCGEVSTLKGSMELTFCTLKFYHEHPSRPSDRFAIFLTLEWLIKPFFHPHIFSSTLIPFSSLLHTEFIQTGLQSISNISRASIEAI